MKTTITISETDPGTAPSLDATAELTAKTHFRRQFKGTREAILVHLEQIRELPRVYKTLLAEEIAAADPNEKYLRVDVFRHPHGSGANLGITVTALK